MAAVLVLSSALATRSPVASTLYPGGGPPEPDLAAYRALSDSRSRDYDKTQDISPRQLVLLLEVAERTGANLGQALATGEHESARTWNDHVRPTLKSGNLGSATGVWQFQPATFHGIIKTYGNELLAASAADPASGREHLDLGDGPFTDDEVRGLIRETANGERGVEDEALQLLRHNFAVLAFAKHYLSRDTGATTPEEDYLFHFLGAGEGRRVLELARGEARDTLCVRPREEPLDPLSPPSELLAGEARLALMKATAMARELPGLARDPAADVATDPELRVWVRSQGESGDGRISTLKSRVGIQSVPPSVLEAAAPPIAFEPEPAVSSQWGLPADSPTVTGNLGMFYRDGKAQTQPYTWGEFMENLARRVRADKQPAMVRAKYGVGFRLEGGDVPGTAFDPEAVTEGVEFRHRDGRTLVVPESFVMGPLDRQEAEHYKQRLWALVTQADAEPMDALPPESLWTLQHLGLLPEGVQGAGTEQPQVRKALQAFRKKVGKDAPDDPAYIDRLMPAERIALEIYDRRLAHYAALQSCQAASSEDAPDLNRIRKLPAGLQRLAAPHVIAVQNALAEQGLLKQPTKKHVWRDKRRKKHVAYKPVPFQGKVDKATVAALGTFQLRHGLRVTEGVLDAVTLELLGLPPMGPEIFLPVAGPHCEIPGGTQASCAIPGEGRVDALGIPGPAASLPGGRLLDTMSCPDCSGAEREAS